MQGSAGTGNGGWAALGLTGSDLTSDAMSETWRLPPLFPYLPAPVDTLLHELENLVWGHC